jgi:hypothetical protein
MLKHLLQYRLLLVLAGAALLLNLFSGYPAAVEKAYTYGAYPVLSRIMRLLTGWLPFSLGDLVYAAAGISLIAFVWRSIKNIRRKPARAWWLTLLNSIGCTLLLVYIVFIGLWGLNYSRLGIARQLQLNVQPYRLPDVVQLTETLQVRLNQYAAQVDTVKRAERHTNSKLFKKAISVYKNAATLYPFLTYQAPSIKPSLYSGVGHYFGFTGYYNPISGEAQLNTTVPFFLKPFVITHEVAHQLGYAKENEANFVAFLSSKEATDVDFLYSLYYDLYSYALREVYNRDTAIAMGFQKRLHPLVLRDNNVLKAYFLRTQNPIEPLITRFYDQYLKLNHQKQGVQTYNEVVALLIAYGKKRGWAAI